jgi:hypothetical protein
MALKPRNPASDDGQDRRHCVQGRRYDVQHRSQRRQDLRGQFRPGADQLAQDGQQRADDLPEGGEHLSRPPSRAGR